ncbi:thioredoxin fold domain-containing protein [Pseudomonas luteola]
MRSLKSVALAASIATIALVTSSQVSANENLKHTSEQAFLDSKTAILAKMSSVFPTAQVSSVTKLSEITEKVGVTGVDSSNPMLNLYEVKLSNGARVYTDPTARLWIVSRQGLDFISTPNEHDIININGIADRGDTLRILKELSDTIDFKAPKEIATVTVFVDVQCGYCHKLFDERQTYLDKGITLRFAAAPIYPESTEMMSTFWCSPTAREDLIAIEAYLAKHREDKSLVAPKLGNGTSCASVIEKQSEMAKQLGLKGTPLLVLPNGDKLPGYYSADDLFKTLQKQ